MYLHTLGLKKSEVHYWLANFHVNNMPGKGISISIEKEFKNEEDDSFVTDEPTPTTSLPVKKRSNQVQQIKTLNRFFEDLPTLPSHYCRKNCNKFFLQSDIKSLSHLYEIYKVKCMTQNEEPMSRFSFDKIKREKM